jgi:hypothetical protein
MAESIWDRDIYPLARTLAKYAFRNDRERMAKVSDVVSTSWQFFQAAPDAPPPKIVEFAIKRVRVGRQFPESERSISKRRPERREPTPIWSGLGDSFFRDWDDPARVVAFRMDFAAFLESLKPRDLAILISLGLGEKTQDVAKEFGLSEARISQLRREFADKWYAFREG